MNNRKEYNKKLVEINETYWELKTQMMKDHVPALYIERLNKIRRNLVDQLDELYSDDLMKLNSGKQIVIKG